MATHVQGKISELLFFFADIFNCAPFEPKSPQITIAATHKRQRLTLEHFGSENLNQTLSQPK